MGVNGYREGGAALPQTGHDLQLAVAERLCLTRHVCRRPVFTMVELTDSIQHNSIHVESRDDSWVGSPR